MLEDRGDETQVTVLTTLNVTGKPAQFGRGVMNEVGGRLLNIFATNLAATLAEDSGAVAGAGATGSADGAAGSPTATGTNGAGPGATTQPAGSTTTGAAAAAASGAAPSAPAAATSGADRSIDELKLPARATSSLHKDGITTAGQLAAKSEDELLAIDGIGPASVDDIKAKLSDLGLTLGQSHAAAPVSAPAPAASAPAPAASAAPAVVSHAAAARHAAQQLEDDAINLLKVAGMPVLKRAIPVVAGVIAALLIGLRAKARRRKK